MVEAPVHGDSPPYNVLLTTGGRPELSGMLEPLVVQWRARPSLELPHS
ncbi:hypothetical protein [Nonomuraea longispora]|nr:hypothetical protein [Nonomuraea longispora]